MFLKLKSPKSKRLNKLSITKKQANDYGLIATSYHESAHTIVGLINLLMVDSVSVVDSQEGDTNYFIYHAEDADNKNLKNKIVMSEIKTVYAGLVGEKAYYRDICGSNQFPMHLRDGSSIDTKIASNLIRKYKLAEPGKPTYRLKQEIKQEVEQTLQEHWSSVKIVAHALYRKKNLTFSELKYLLTRTSDNRDFWKEKFRKIKIIYDDKNDLDNKEVRNLIVSKLIQ